MRPEKCYWSLVDFEFISGRWRYIKFDDFNGDIQVKDTNGRLQTVERFDIDKAKEGLGIFVTPNGSMNMQLERISEKSINGQINSTLVVSIIRRVTSERILQSLGRFNMYYQGPHSQKGNASKLNDGYIAT